MLPKEHGAWNVLLVSLFSGWIALGRWETAAMAATVLWVSAFCVRAPISRWLQYRRADPSKARYAAVWGSILSLFAVFSGCLFIRSAPGFDIRLTLGVAFPIAGFILLLAWNRRPLRSMSVEVIGFAGICLAAPVLYMCAPLFNKEKTFWLYFLTGGYFVLTLFYVKVRQKWVTDARNGFRPGTGQRVRAGKFPIFHQLCFFGVTVLAAPSWTWAAGPLYSLVRALFGIARGRADLTIMKLGMREMVHSLVYMTMVLFFWKAY